MNNDKDPIMEIRLSEYAQLCLPLFDVLSLLHGFMTACIEAGVVSYKDVVIRQDAFKDQHAEEFDNLQTIIDVAKEGCNEI